MSRPGSTSREDGPSSPPLTPLQSSRARPQASSLTPTGTPEDRRRRPSIRLRRPPSYQTIVRRPSSALERPPSGQGPIAQPSSASDIRRLSASAVPLARPRAGTSSHAVIYERPSMDGGEVEGNRRRSSSDPLRLNRPSIAGGSQRNPPYMPGVREDGILTEAEGTMPQNLAVPVESNRVRKRSSVTSIAGSLLRFPTWNNSSTSVDVEDPEQYNEQLVDLLDTVGTWKS
jgi:hypothetical protein